LSWTVDVAFKKSLVHGRGVFAKKRISAGTRVWEFDESMRVCDRETMMSLEPRHLRFALHGGYLHKPSDWFIWYTDGMQYMNHGAGAHANVGLGYWPSVYEDHTVALRDIEPGEELFEDYGFWADGGLSPTHWLRKLYREHCPEHFAFLISLNRLAEAA
jgi:hypothetical protein